MQKRILVLLVFFLNFFLLKAQDLDSLQKIQVEKLVKNRVDSLLKLKLDSIQQANAPKPTPPKPAFLYRFLADASLSTGNVDRKLLVLRSELSYTKGIFELDMNPRYAFGEQNGQIAERDFYTDLNFAVFHPKVVYGFGLGILETSNLRAIDLRLLSGLGIGFHILRLPNANFSITNALIYESTDFRSGDDVLTIRNSTRLKGKYNFLKNRLRMTHLILVQPSVQTSNLRWSALLGLEIPLHRALTLRSTLNNSYESVVQEGRKNNDMTWTIGLAFGNK